MIIGWEQVKNIIELYSEANYMIKRFYSDYEDQLSNYSTDGESFPVLYMTPIGGQLRYTQNTFTVRFYCFDRIIRSRENWNNIIDDCYRCLNDLYKFLQSNDVGLIDTERIANIIPINDALMDYVAGWYMDVDIDIDTYSDCYIMIDGVPAINDNGGIFIAKYLTCNSLLECPVIEDIEDEIFSLTSSVIDIEDEIFSLTSSVIDIEDDITQLYSGLTALSDDINNLELNDLTDVNITGATAGEALLYNGTDWVNGPISVASTLEDLTDVVITGVTAGEALLYNGTDWVNGPVATSSEGTLGIVFDGFGGTIIANQQYPFLTVPFNCTIDNWSIVADTTGDIEIDIWRLNAAIPTVADSIVNSNYITLTAGQINSGTPTGWTSVNLLAGDIINFNVRMATTIIKATLTLKITK
jgi:hypothetical protein